MPRLFPLLALLCALGGAAQADSIRVPDTMAQRTLACAGCHGAQGKASPEGYLPRIAGKPAGYLFEQLLNLRDGRRPHEGMARLTENLSETYLREIAEHFAALDLPYPPPVPSRQSAADAQRAEALVRRGDPARQVPACASCHGQALTGIAPAVPGLLGLPADYLIGQLGAWQHGLRRARAPDCMATLAQRLAPEDVVRVAQWLQAQPVPKDAKASTVAPTKWPMDCGSVPK
jgi:cytochrome c553